MKPSLAQIAAYDRTKFAGDASAGLTVGVMLIPQGMAYALIAGLPPIYGLYASLVPLIVYALFGTSRQLAVGPVAMVSLLVAAGVAPLAGGDGALYVGYALLLSLLVGVLQFGLGVARFGFLANFLSHPVLAGFTSAAALIIGFSQLKHLLGVNLVGSHLVHEVLIDAMRRLAEVNGGTILVGSASIVALLLMRRYAPRLPGALIVVAAATLVSWYWSLDARGVAVVGAVPGGLPGPALPLLDVAAVKALAPTALAIALVGFMESYAVAKVYATRHKYGIDANRELIGLGLANVAGSFFQAFPTTGGFSRTAVNDQAGARTKIAAIFSAGIVALTLLFLTGLFHHLPKAVLAAIVMVAVFKLIDIREVRFLWNVDRMDFALLVVTFLATLSLGIELGILVGVAASLVVVVYQSSRPHTAVLGRLPGSDVFKNVDRFPEAEVVDGVVVLRFDASLYFANTAFLKDRINELRTSGDVRALVLDFYPVNRIDATGVHALRELVDELRRDSVDVHFAGVKGPVMDKLRRSGVAALVGDAHFHKELIRAVDAAARVPQEPERAGGHVGIKEIRSGQMVEETNV